VREFTANDLVAFATVFGLSVSFFLTPPPGVDSIAAPGAAASVTRSEPQMSLAHHRSRRSALSKSPTSRPCRRQGSRRSSPARRQRANRAGEAVGARQAKADRMHTTKRPGDGETSRGRTRRVSSMPAQKSNPRRREAVVEARKRADLTQQAPADRLGVDRTTIARVEAGTPSPSVELGVALARELGTTAEALFGDGR
jgi:DNA-binding XRE family transcriptional regulator